MQSLGKGCRAIIEIVIANRHQVIAERCHDDLVGRPGGGGELGDVAHHGVTGGEQQHRVGRFGADLVDEILSSHHTAEGLLISARAKRSRDGRRGRTRVHYMLALMQTRGGNGHHRQIRVLALRPEPQEMRVLVVGVQNDESSILWCDRRSFVGAAGGGGRRVGNHLARVGALHRRAAGGAEHHAGTRRKR